MKDLILLMVTYLDRKSFWVIKKQLISFIWCIIHTIILSIIAVKVIETRLEFTWIMIVLVYVSFYTIITNILFDIINGYVADKIDD